jgi:hypothetical protein
MRAACAEEIDVERFLEEMVVAEPQISHSPLFEIAIRSANRRNGAFHWLVTSPFRCYDQKVEAAREMFRNWTDPEMVLALAQDLEICIPDLVDIASNEACAGAAHALFTRVLEVADTFQDCSEGFATAREELCRLVMEGADEIADAILCEEEEDCAEGPEFPLLPADGQVRLVLAPILDVSDQEEELVGKEEEEEEEEFED